MSQQNPSAVPQPAPATGIDPWGERMMKIIWRKPPADLAEKTRRRATVHLIPFLFFLYILAYLDRINVSVAANGMSLGPDAQGLGFTDEIIGAGASLFFVGYWILEIPSTLSVAKWGARWVFVRILLLWGLCAAVAGLIGLPMMESAFRWLPETGNWNYFGSVSRLINGLRTGDAEQQFYFFRFMLGFFEGGFFPSVIVYLSMWFPQKDRAKAIAIFMAAIPVSGVVGMPFSTWVSENVHWFGLAGWRWVFILEGVAPMLAGIATIFMLPSGPADAKWLPEDERKLLESTLEVEHADKLRAGHGAWVHHLGMVLLLTCVYFCLNVSSYGLSTFLPTIIKKQSGVSAGTAGYLSTLPYAMALIAMLINGWHSDKTRERVWHVAGSLATLSIGLFSAYLLFDHPIAAVMIMICVVGPAMYAHLPAFWPIPTVFLGAATAASAIGFINMVGNLGGWYGPKFVGKLGVTSFADALLALSPWGMAAATIIVAVGLYRDGKIKRMVILLTAFAAVVGSGFYYRWAHPPVENVPAPTSKQSKEEPAKLKDASPEASPASEPAK